MEAILISASVALICSLLPDLIRWLRQIHQEKRDKLTLMVCDDIAINNHELFVKIINKSSYAEATNIVVDMRIETDYSELLCEMKTKKLGCRVLLSKTNAREKKEQEVLLKYNLDSIQTQRFHLINSRLNDLYKEEKLTLSDVLQSNVKIKVKINAVNTKTGKTVFPKMSTFTSENIKSGSFCEGEEKVKSISQFINTDNAIDS